MIRNFRTAQRLGKAYNMLATFMEKLGKIDCKTKTMQRNKKRTVKHIDRLAQILT